MRRGDLPIKRVARIVGGSTPSADAVNWDGDINWLSPTDISPHHGGYVGESARRLSDQGLAACGAFMAPARSVVVTTRAPIGNVAITTLSSATNQGCRTIVPSSGLDPRFLRYQLQVRVAELQSRGSGSTFLELSGSTLGMFHIHVPGLAMQQAVAEFLDRECARIDELYSLAGAQAEALRRWEDRRISELLDAPTSPVKTFLRDACVGIVVQPAQLYTDSGEIMCFRAVNVGEGTLHAKELMRITRDDHLARRRSELDAGDVVVVRSGQAGAAAVVPEWAAGSNCVDLLVLRPDLGRCVPHYLAEALNSARASGEIDRLSVGSIQGHMNLSVVRRLGCPNRDLEGQAAVLLHIGEVRRQSRQMEEELGSLALHLTEYRDALITEAVTGQLDIPNLSDAQMDESLDAARQGEPPEVLAS